MDIMGLATVTSEEFYNSMDFLGGCDMEDIRIIVVDTLNAWDILEGLLEDRIQIYAEDNSINADASRYAYDFAFKDVYNYMADYFANLGLTDDETELLDTYVTISELSAHTFPTFADVDHYFAQIF